ncbi:MAG: BMP family ABC transporter substrate-binding protein [Selenomonadaceae bacterium]|nr:BMP family ABC transporter substrate-binding protein [Selenomonadaceae bacterium]
MKATKPYFHLSSDEELSGRFRWLSVCTTLALVVMIFLSVAEFGQEKKAPPPVTARTDSAHDSLTDNLYERDYLAGIIAGLRTRSNRVGYIAAAGTTGIYQRINAYALGVQRVNGSAQVLLVWTRSYRDSNIETRAVHALKGERADVFSYSLNDDTIPEAAERLNFPFIATYDVKGSYKQCLAKVEGSHKLLPMALTTRELAYEETARWELKRGYIIFAGDMYDRSGLKRCTEGEAMNRAGRDRMDWLIRGVSVLES